MSAVDSPDPDSLRRCRNRFRRHCWLPDAVLMLSMLLAGTIGCGSSPEVRSEAGLKSLDALYTAVTSRKPELVDQCVTHIARLKDSGDLSGSAADFLEGVIRMAQAGDWQQSAETLDRYIRLQTRH